MVKWMRGEFVRRDVKMLAKWFRDFADYDPHAGSRGVRELVLSIADDAKVLALAEFSRRGQPVPNLLLACGRYIRSLQGGELGGGDAVDEMDYPHFRDLVLAHQQEVRHLMVQRRVQTNEVGRCAPLRLAIGAATAMLGHGVRLVSVEIGASAGLNLFWDKYSYDFGVAMVAGEPSIVLTCQLEGNVPPRLPLSLPEVHRRVGIDVHPLSVTSLDDLRWLEALIPAADGARRDRLRAAASIVATDPPDMIEGDGCRDLPDVIAAIPSECVPLVFHSHTTYQWAPEERDALSACIDRIGRVRSVWYVCQEPCVDAGDSVRNDRLLVHCYAGGDIRFSADLGTCEQYGAWVRWSPKEVADGPI